jgi:hypothetical protein
MRAITRLCPLALAVVVSLAGCAKEPPPSPDPEAKIKAALAQLSPEDRKVAEEQKFCAVEHKNRLGSMGKPFKVMVKDQPVFLCCKGCETAALEDPDKTLAAVKELKGEPATPPGEGLPAPRDSR